MPIGPSIFGGRGDERAPETDKLVRLRAGLFPASELGKEKALFVRAQSQKLVRAERFRAQEGRF